MTKSLSYHDLHVKGLYSTYKKMVDFPRGCGCTNLVFYNLETGVLWCETVKVGGFIEYENKNIIKIYAGSDKISKQKLLDKVHYGVLCNKVNDWLKFIEKHNLSYDQVKDDEFLYAFLKEVYN